MPYHSIVLVKQVPDTRNVTGEVMTKDGTMNRSALPAIFNPEDLNALEMALQVKEQHGGTVTVLTMGPLQAAEVLRQSLYRGADRVILLSDRKFAGADTQATSYTLKCAIDKIGAFDLVFCGRQAIDGDTAQVGPAGGGEAGRAADHLCRGHPAPGRGRDRGAAGVRARHGDGQVQPALPADRGRQRQPAAPALRPPADRQQAGSDPRRVSRPPGAVA